MFDGTSAPRSMNIACTAANEAVMPQSPQVELMDGIVVTGEGPHRRTSHLLADRRPSFSSCSSLSSFDSGGGGGKFKPTFGRIRKGPRTFSPCPSVPSSLKTCDLPRRVGTKKERRGSNGKSSSMVSLLRRPSRSQGRQSAPTLSLRNRPSPDNVMASRNNEEWDLRRTNKPRQRPQEILCNYEDELSRSTPRSCMKYHGPAPTQTHKRRAVTFREVSQTIGPATPYTHESWYSSSECDDMMKDSVSKAESIRLFMIYASTNESSYNSATGLTSPHVLTEYLSSPEEVIGIEHFLAGQGRARSSLITYHKKALLEHSASDSTPPRTLVAERLRNNSTIAAHMARERATYCVLID